jgi:hypothetical protein
MAASAVHLEQRHPRQMLGELLKEHRLLIA